MDHTIILDKYHASPSRIRLGTYGSYGFERIHLEVSEEWKGLVLEASFSICGQEPVTVIVDMDTLSFEVPAEAVARAGEDGSITIKGVGEGKRIFSKSVAYTVEEHSGSDGNLPVPPTPTEVEQILQIANRAKENAKVAVTAAENADTAAATANIAANNANRVADALTAEKNAGAFNGADGYTPVKGIDYGTPEEITEISRQAADMLAPEVNQIKSDLSANDRADANTRRKLDCLWKLNQGISYQFETDDTEAYSKTVPSGAKLASVEAIGGHTEVINGELVSAEVQSVMESGKNLLDNAKFEPSVFTGDSIYNGYGGGKWHPGVIAAESIGKAGDVITYQAYIDARLSTKDNENHVNVWINTLDRRIIYSGNTICSGNEGVSTVTFKIPDNALTISCGLFIAYKGTVTIKNAMVERASAATTYARYHTPALYAVPSVVQQLPGYGWSAEDVCNSIERTDTGWQYVQRVGSRVYQEGDTVTDGVTTYYALENPVITDITELMVDFPANFEAEAGGRLSFENAAELPIPNSVEYLISLAEVNQS